ncbi:flagellar biosynthesis protein FlhA [Caldanaerobius fijiensis DSM 17918]|uniref:Flagellar biosynthesis protein FlhA n=1 Tax=Caldanaerobius fijiensis DSM 17918 TaxID=1121256 RepID=A0A1M4XKQ6_9THEO|nr:flagellar biosynthesis protein FlhA [Caldanaerobius fijiensis DSM 17918]
MNGNLKYGDIAVSVIILVVILMIIIPLPPRVLDVMITLNISLSIMILLTTMFINKSLDFSIFPSLLLITTLFRLALNISSTRLILKDGYAGDVIQAFGSFVIGGNIVVGLIVFLIIIVVQFIVITRGAERVAEVAARFTLDAMPGKQMAIDADLNTGIINDAEAKRRRQEIQREADFYGAMDGASKFVKGDAIASIIITLINIIGGIVIGLVFNTGMDIAAVFNKYTILTVGDGLVSQIPALLVSTATGIIVTRAASDSNLGNDVLKQLLVQPRILMIASAFLFAMGLIGLPKLPNFIMAGIFGYLGYTLKQSYKVNELKETQAKGAKEAEEMKKIENVLPLVKVDPIELEFGYGLIPFADANQAGNLLDRVVMIRRQLALELGVVIPMVRLRDNIQLGNNEYAIKIRGNVVAKASVIPDSYLAMNPGGAKEDIMGIKTVEPVFGLPAIWISQSQIEKAEMSGYTVVDPTSVIATHLTEVLKRHIHEILTRQDVQQLIDNIRPDNNALIDELIPKNMSLGDVQKVLCNLLRERIPVRDMVTILETLADYSPIVKDVDLLTEYVRQSLKRTITGIYAVDNKIYAITLDPNLEKLIADSIKKTEMGSYLSLDPGKINAIVNNIAEGLKKFVSAEQQPVILTSPVIRPYVRQITEPVFRDLPVLSYNELLPEIAINVLWKVNVP